MPLMRSTPPQSNSSPSIPHMQIWHNDLKWDIYIEILRLLRYFFCLYISNFVTEKILNNLR